MERSKIQNVFFIQFDVLYFICLVHGNFSAWNLFHFITDYTLHYTSILLQNKININKYK